MVELGDLISIKAILPKVKAATKTGALEVLAERAASISGINARTILDAIQMRESLGGTGVGEGVAIPHARIEGIQRVFAVLARLDPAQDFDAHDRRPADLVCLLVAPADAGADHLKALARVSRALRRAEVRVKLRAAASIEALHAIMATRGEDAHAA
jgi:PTS system nitrogen regulatory IIA component